MTQKKNAGFSLIEVLLVMIVISMIIYMGIGYIQQKTLATRIDRTSMQIQQIQNAALAYYLGNGKWPSSIDSDLRPNYLPNYTPPLNNAWGQTYAITNNGTQFFVVSAITGSGNAQATAAANVIAGTLPMSYTTTANLGASTPPNAPAPPAKVACTNTSTTCRVVSSVPIPGQNLNNAASVNYAGLYHNGACVPMPKCPQGSSLTMTPQIMVVPVSVNGVFDNDTDVYPISSFTGYATKSPNGGNQNQPPSCDGSIASAPCYDNGTNVINNGPYWRVCLRMTTARGNPTNEWGKQVTVMAITRCAINGENVGSTFSIYTN